MAEEKVEQLLKSFQSLFFQAQPQISECQKILSQLKIALIEFELVPPFTRPPQETSKHLFLARETLELAVLLSIAQEDEKAFERHVSQVKPYYYDYAHLLPPSERKWQTLGLLLLHLLSQNRMGEFHTEIELIALADQKILYIDFPIQLEKRLMEGTYNKVLNAHKDVPLPSYTFFMNKLANTMRTKIAESEATVYKKGEEATRTEVKEPPRAVTDASLDAEGSSGGAATLPSHKLIVQTLLYATELERII